MQAGQIATMQAGEMSLKTRDIDIHCLNEEKYGFCWRRDGGGLKEMYRPEELYTALSGSPSSSSPISSYSTLLPKLSPGLPPANSPKLRQQFFTNYGPARCLLPEYNAGSPESDADPAAAAEEADPGSPDTEGVGKGWMGARPVPLLVSVGVGILLRFAVTKPEEVSMRGWQLLAIFLSTITGLVLGPLPVGAWAFVGLAVAVLTNTLPFEAAFSAFSSQVIWLIVISFFFARGFVKTGLGDRVATYFVKWLGGSTLGLSYGLTLSEAVVAPAMPSSTARAGGIFLPIIKALAVSSGSKPEDATASKMGAYLVITQFQTSGNSGALFLTGAAQNLLCVQLAEKLGVLLSGPWLQWFKAASLPASVGMLTTPLLLYHLFPPEVKETPEAPLLAHTKLQNMGAVSRDEWIMLGTMLLAVSLWVLGDALGVASVVAAMLALSVLLLLGVLTWDDCLSEKTAWDTLAWFAVLVGMAEQLSSLGVVQWVSDSVALFLASYALPWPAAFAILHALYFLLHYLFASQTGHVGALYSAFLAMQLGAGVPPILAALSLAYNTNLLGALTHYSSGQAAVYFGAGYVHLSDIFKYGAICAAWNWVVWSLVGCFWWKIIGIF